MARRRRIRNRGSVEQLGPGRWRARIRGKAPNGRPYSFGGVFPTREEAERALEGYRRQAHDIESGNVVLEETITLAVWVKRVRARRNDGRQRLLKWARRDSSTFKYLRPLWSMPMTALDAGRLRGWAEWMRGRGYAENTIGSAYVLLRRIVGAALESQVLVRLPWGDARLSLVNAEERGTRDGLEPDEWTRVAAAARAIDADEARAGSNALRDLWLRLAMLRVTATRPVELAQCGPALLVPGPHGAMLNVHDGIIAKGGKPGLRVIGATLAAELAAHVARMPAAAARCGLYFPKKALRGRWSARWIVDAQGYKTGRDFVMQSELDALRERSGVATFDPYQLRHTRLDELAHDVGPTFAQNQGGHKSQRTTARYIHTSARHLTEECFEVDGALGAGAPSSGPKGDGGGGKKRRGRFLVHDGDAKSGDAGDVGAAGGELLSFASAERSVHVPSALRAHAVHESHGHEEGAGPVESAPVWSAEDVAGALEYVAAIEAHGVLAVALNMHRTLGPEALVICGEIDRGAGSAEGISNADRVALYALVGALRAHACTRSAPTTTKTGSKIDENINDVRAVLRAHGIRSTRINPGSRPPL